MSNDVAPALRWRQLAAKALEAAAELTDAQAKAIMLDIASRYERLAEYAEVQASRKNPDKSE